MSVYVESGDDVRVPFPGGAAPSGSTWRYRDAAGATVGALVGQALTNSEAVVPGSANTLSGTIYLNRFLKFSTSPEMVSIVVTRPYMLTMTPSFARGLIGFNDAELSDEDLDLIGAALDLDVRYEGAFQAKLIESQDAQRLVGYHALVRLEGSMRARIAQTMKSTDVSFSRFRDFDIDKVLDGIKGERDRLSADLFGAEALSVFQPPLIFGLGATRTDPYPGA